MRLVGENLIGPRLTALFLIQGEDVVNEDDEDSKRQQDQQPSENIDHPARVSRRARVSKYFVAGKED